MGIDTNQYISVELLNKMRFQTVIFFNSSMSCKKKGTIQWTKNEGQRQVTNMCFKTV